jgi:hypothetical protein
MIGTTEMIWKTTNGLGQEVTWYDQQEIEQMDKKHTKFITALADLYKVIFKSESTKEVDFLLESLHEKGEAIRKKVEDGN